MQKQDKETSQVNLRPIRFRVWDGEDMYVLAKIECNNGLWFAANDGETGYHLDRYESIMQYTGLKDKNGVEIFVGDIIKIHPEMDIREIAFSQDEARFYAAEKESGHDELHPLMWGNNAEVIGNIYENKDLLTKNN